MGVSTVVLASLLNACGHVASAVLPGSPVGTTPARKPDVRMQALSRAQVWRSTNVASMDIAAGPKDRGAFPFRATVSCDYVDRTLSGASPKFACLMGDDELKVKFGGANAEVYGEVAATRLLWALGFGADRMYPVRVICRGCPREFAGISRDNDEWVFDPAVIERKMDGVEFPGNGGWSFDELEAIDEKAGGAPRAHVDALKLLAVFMQHTDTKPQQQRLVCLGAKEADRAEDIDCSRPFMLFQDVGLTFGKANAFNVNHMAMHLKHWAATPIWKDAKTCVGDLPKSLKGTLDDPVISEAGRAFLASLLTQMSDRQIRDLFEVSRVELRLRAPGKALSGFATVDEWVSAFKQKRNEIVDHRCA